MLSSYLAICFAIATIPQTHGQECITEDKVDEIISLLRTMQQSTTDSLTATRDVVDKLKADVEILQDKCRGGGDEEDGVTSRSFISNSSPISDQATDDDDDDVPVVGAVDSSQMPTEAPIAAHPHTCKDLLDLGNKYDGVQEIYVGDKPVRVWCDMENGGWTVFQRRFDGSTNFKQNFAAYRQGFGNRKKEYWFGLEKMYQMTLTGKWILRVDMEDDEGNTGYALYIDFKIGPGPGYVLNYRSYSGNVGNALNYNNGQRFSTFDRDQDSHGSISCSSEAYRNGAWWYSYCGNSNLNAFVYGTAETRPMKGMVWYTWKGQSPLKATMMKFKQM